MLRLILIVALCAAAINCQMKFDEKTPFANKASLSGSTYELAWNRTSTDIIIKVTVQTNGYVGFGLSPDGNMGNSDAVVAWTKTDGTVAFRDASLVNRAIQTDKTQNWMKLFYSKTNGVTTVIFTRKLLVSGLTAVEGEKNIDVTDSNFVVYAWGFVNPLNNEPIYHLLSRGSKSVKFLANTTGQVPLTLWEMFLAHIQSVLSLFGNFNKKP